MPTNLSPSFTLEELSFSHTAVRLGIRNVPNQAQVAALRDLCENILQPLRDELKGPLVVSSGFRSPKLNELVNGAENSQHLTGQAADLQCHSLPLESVFQRVLQLQLPFDQLIIEGSRASAWVHVSFDRDRSRGEVLRANFPKAGGVRYARLTPAEALALKV